MSTTVILALVVGIGVLMIFIGLARTPSSSTALNVQQRLAAYGGEKQLTIEDHRAGRHRMYCLTTLR